MNENIMMVRGDTLQFSVEINDLEKNLTSAFFSCKKSKDDDEYVFQVSLNDGIELSDSSETMRLYTVTVPASATEDVDEGIYYFDLQISVDDYVFTPAIGTLQIVQDVTI